MVGEVGGIFCKGHILNFDAEGSVTWFLLEYDPAINTNLDNEPK